MNKPLPPANQQAPNALAPSRRLALREPPYEPEVQQAIDNTAFKGLSPQNLRLALAHHPGLAKAFQSMAHVVLFKCAVSEREREIAIIRTGALTRSEYEWGMHVSIYGAKCQLDAAAVRALTLAPAWHDLDASAWTAAERLVVRMADELHHHSTLADQTWQQMVATWPREQVIELIFAASFYRMAAGFLNSTAVPLEIGAERFPAGLTQAEVPAR